MSVVRPVPRPVPHPVPTVRCWRRRRLPGPVLASHHVTAAEVVAWLVIALVVPVPLLLWSGFAGWAWAVAAAVLVVTAGLLWADRVAVGEGYVAVRRLLRWRVLAAVDPRRHRPARLRERRTPRAAPRRAGARCGTGAADARRAGRPAPQRPGGAAAAPHARRGALPLRLAHAGDTPAGRRARKTVVRRGSPPRPFSATPGGPPPPCRPRATPPSRVRSAPAPRSPCDRRAPR